ncbi:MAG: LysM peptidoglycan-binding domain-containing protein, partial [Candidatus Omnitrophica bacterium]|nr:LysM peptidoglycan-binding domain-containing protein [Candidatus Omnitrophota bacterium]
MFRKKDLLKLSLLFLNLLILNSCATTPTTGPMEVYPKIPTGVIRQDIFHIVSPGETLWRISKMYDANMEDIMRANNINDPRNLEMGQKLFIPGAAPLRPVIPLYKTDKW